MSSIKILIADDHQMVIDGITAFLNNVADFDVVATVNDGVEVLRLAKLLDINVVIMDISMPLLNGIDTTRQLLAEHPEIKVLALTMHDQKGTINKMMEAGAKGYVLKSTNKNELIEAVRTIASGKTYFSGVVEIAMTETSSTQITTSKVRVTDSILTEREVEILKLITQGLSSTKISEKLFISPRTADKHRVNLMKKLNLTNIAGVIRYGMENGYID